MTYRQRANGILALSFICFGLIFWYWSTHEISTAVEILFFVIQSALIGSIADWFAVTALFDKPLGFPWHTELLYGHRNQIIDSVTKIVSEKLLQPQLWQNKLYSISFMDKLINWLQSPNGRDKFRAILYEVAQRIYQYAQKGDTQSSIASHIRAYLKRQPMVSFFQDRIISLLENPDSQMFQDAVGLGKELVNSDDFEVMMERMIREWMDESKSAPGLLVTLNKFTGIVDTKKIAKDIKIGIVKWLDTMQHAEGEERDYLCQKFELFLYSMNGQLAYGVQNWQDEFVDSLPIERWITATEQAGKDYFTSGDSGREELKDLLEEQFLHYVQYCHDYPEIKEWLDDQIRKACMVIIENEHGLIGIAVRDVLSGFDKRKFNAFIESKVGEDLAWIRINGAIVGATLGLAVFVFSYFLYEPYVVPLLRSLIL
jgi:uncharacterized membrane-anchored protein YjiN (DUF445 family)